MQDKSKDVKDKSQGLMEEARTHLSDAKEEVLKELHGWGGIMPFMFSLSCMKIRSYLSNNAARKFERISKEAKALLKKENASLYEYEGLANRLVDVEGWRKTLHFVIKEIFEEKDAAKYEKAGFDNDFKLAELQIEFHFTQLLKEITEKWLECLFKNNVMHIKTTKGNKYPPHECLEMLQGTKNFPGLATLEEIILKKGIDSIDYKKLPALEKVVPTLPTGEKLIISSFLKHRLEEKREEVNDAKLCTASFGFRK